MGKYYDCVLPFIVEARDGWGEAVVGAKQLKTGKWRAYLIGRSPSLTIPMKMNGNYLEAPTLSGLGGILEELAYNLT